MLVSTLVAVAVLWNLAMIGEYLTHPRYRLVDTSLKIKKMIEAQHEVNPAASELLIGRGAQEISLLSGGLVAMDSDGAMPLAKKLDVYHPGWFMDWTSQSPARKETVAAHRPMVERATFPNLDRSRDAGIVLYQISPRGLQ